ncbi:hypothetical protein QBC32DRAFT_120875 [Pseudoneurospora amorphoporcata]|uniref:MOZ protein represents a chromatin-associated acetyltransferase n=1 Tax=Pseudoneurospora amorphoporcata TaxID=241081 RepID=A0AAN6P060_9PEZI|nr:hypothetical protein QBC32DRAFT_120875 [Pseudoneurospora amorphoporcata]
MATPGRLTFLYPQLFRTGALWSEPAAARVARKPRRHVASQQSCCAHTASAPFSSSASRRQAAFVKYGKAVEPQPLHEETPASSTDPSPSADSKPKAAPAPAEKQQQQQPEQTEPATPKEGVPDAPKAATTSGPPEQPPTAAAAKTGSDPSADKKSATPLETILYMEPPPSDHTTRLLTDPENGNGRPPHLQPPPYVHHFDSYSLVKQLSTGGYTLPQAITAMKAVRGLLASNLDVAQAGLVSKSDVENETYLFRAACSELSTEVKNNRRVADEQLRQQRTHLLHEVDILTQRLNQELLTLNDNVRGMFNDRKMAVREEQKAVDSRIQQINYKISVILNSDARSDIEALRWVLIRRSVLGILFMAVATLGTLRYATFVNHERQKEADRKKREAEEARRHDGTRDGAPAPMAAEILMAN